MENFVLVVKTLLDSSRMCHFCISPIGKCHRLSPDYCLFRPGTLALKWRMFSNWISSISSRILDVNWFIELNTIKCSHLRVNSVADDEFKLVRVWGGNCHLWAFVSSDIRHTRRCLFSFSYSIQGLARQRILIVICPIIPVGPWFSLEIIEIDKPKLCLLVIVWVGEAWIQIC